LFRSSVVSYVMMFTIPFLILTVTNLHLIIRGWLY
jgi:hypothetical protein